MTEGTPVPAPLLLTLSQSAGRIGVSLPTLRRWLEESPADLPGRPMPIGAGSKRDHVRWLPADIDVWLAAFAKWQRGEWKPPARRVPPRPARREVRDAG